MTPAEQRALYDSASTPDDVCKLLRARDRAIDAGIIDALRGLISSDPVRAIRILRERVEEEERIGKERGPQVLAASKAFDGKRAARLLDEEQSHLKRAAALRWAATALTRGLAHGRLELGPQNEEAPCACGGGEPGRGFHYPGAVGCLRPDDGEERPVFETRMQAENRA